MNSEKYIGLDVHQATISVSAMWFAFPPEPLSTVRKLSEAGIMLWWFAADWAVARRKFQLRHYPKLAVSQA